MTILGRQPAFWIGLIGTIVLGVVQTLAGQGVVSDLTAGRVVDLTHSLVNLLTLVAPLLAGLAIHTQVTPTIAPVLSVGASVTTPAGGPAQVIAGSPVATFQPAPAAK
jgi:hypothetical protein